MGMTHCGGIDGLEEEFCGPWNKVAYAGDHCKAISGLSLIPFHHSLHADQSHGRKWIYSRGYRSCRVPYRQQVLRHCMQSKRKGKRPRYRLYHAFSLPYVVVAMAAINFGSVLGEIDLKYAKDLRCVTLWTGSSAWKMTAKIILDIFLDTLPLY